MKNKGLLGSILHILRGITAKPYEDAGLMIRKVWLGGLKITSEVTVPEMMELLSIVFRVHIVWLVMYLPIIVMPYGVGIILYLIFFVMSLFTMPITAVAVILQVVRRYNNIGMPVLISIAFVLFATSVEYQWFNGVFVYPKFVSDALKLCYLIIALGAFLPSNLLRRNR